MTNLKTQIEYFLDLRGKITRGEWGKITIEGYMNIEVYPYVPSQTDIQAMSKLPQALALIAELAKEVEAVTEERNHFFNAEGRASRKNIELTEEYRQWKRQGRATLDSLAQENAELKAHIQKLVRDREEKLAKEARISEDLEFLYSIDPNAY